MNEFPACCTPSPSAEVAEILYCAYQMGGPADRAGLNYQGQPCPTWAHLTRADATAAEQAVVAKWRVVAEATQNL